MSTERAEKVTEAQRLRGEGLLLREIAERLGVGISTVWTWLADPNRAGLRANRRRYAGVCIDCGGATCGVGPGMASKRCAECNRRRQHETRIWTPETIIEAIRAFADRYGRQPTVSDWGGPRCTGERRERYQRDGCWPSSWTVQRAFGSWNAAIEAAGFRRRRKSPRGRGRR